MNKKQRECTHAIARLPNSYNPVKPDYRCVKCGVYLGANHIANFLWSRYLGNEKLLQQTLEADQHKREQP
jgi:hypothetical protein